MPEIADGLVEITNVAREPGYRSKIAVVSHADGVDPVGACVGPRGSRVRMVVSELRGEKIDIIPYNDEPARFVAKALSPARVREVLVDDDGKQATVIVPDDQLSLAIGREGQNARLAARLTGWRVDIRSETEFSKQETESGYDDDAGEDVGGRCHAILANGRRCPNAALPSSRYCGLDSHQALEGKPTDVVGAKRQPRAPWTGFRSPPVPGTPGTGDAGTPGRASDPSVVRGVRRARPASARSTASLPWRVGWCRIRSRGSGPGCVGAPLTRMLRRRGGPPRLSAGAPSPGDRSLRKP